MTIILELAPEIEQLAKSQAEAKGISLDEYLPWLVSKAMQQEEWDDEGASQATIAGSETTLRRIWDTPEEDEAWKDL